MTLRLNKRGRELAAAMPPTWERDASQVEAWQDEARKAGAVKVLTMEYCANDDRIYVHESDSLNGWVRGLAPLGIICYSPLFGSDDAEMRMEIVDSGLAWAERNREHLERIAAGGGANISSNAHGTPVGKEAYD